MVINNLLDKRIQREGLDDMAQLVDLLLNMRGLVRVLNPYFSLNLY